MDLPKRYGRPDPEELDPTPLEMPLGACTPPPLSHMIATMVRQAIETEKGDEMETYDEANDFTEDDPDTLAMSQYELTAMEDEGGNPFDPAQWGSTDLETPEPPKGTGPGGSDLPPTGDAPDPNEPEPSEPSPSPDGND